MKVGNTVEDFLLDVKIDVSAGGGPILELDTGMMDVLDGATVLVNASLSVVKVPLAPNSPGSIYSTELEELPLSAEYVALTPTVLNTVDPPASTTSVVGDECPESNDNVTGAGSAAVVDFPGPRTGGFFVAGAVAVLVTLSVNC